MGQDQAARGKAPTDIRKFLVRHINIAIAGCAPNLRSPLFRRGTLNVLVVLF